MSLSGFLFVCWRIFEIVTLIPTMGMLAYFVDIFRTNNRLMPDWLLVLFIGSVLALVWAIGTLFLYSRAKHSAKFVAFIDLCFVGVFIAGVYLTRWITEEDCVNASAGDFYANFGGLYVGWDDGEDDDWGFTVDKGCAMVKASFAFGIMNCIFFFITSLLALMVSHHHRDEVVVRRSHYPRHSHRRHSRSPRHSHHSHRSYYV
ncbi:hypothetical protein BDY21DRAFT_291731 [Lineolata rhizophorae]|uniref:MARVEL domain-containing protein n=1 Tax=Lineolata rhizophorae TaxID=578093 RepID=A0A6A6NSD1_9PEZI|nr:hypothetical protein BDY21DRAFT_291731 [Lineolata rhizophorae]